MKSIPYQIPSQELVAIHETMTTIRGEIEKAFTLPAWALRSRTAQEESYHRAVQSTAYLIRQLDYLQSHFLWPTAWVPYIPPNAVKEQG